MWFDVLLCISNISIKHQSFVYIQLNDQIVLFLTIYFSIRYFFAVSLNVKQFYSTCRECYVLTFWPRQKFHSRWCTGRKWHILMAVMKGDRVGGNWLMKWDEVKKIPLYSHRLTHRKRVTSELDDSYFRSMTITQAIPKLAEVTHPGR